MILSNLFLCARMDVPSLEMEATSYYDSINPLSVITSTVSLEALGF